MQAYLRDQAQIGNTNDDMVKRALQAWQEISRLSVPEPDAAVGEDGMILFFWKSGNYHFELQIFQNEPAEFFFINRATDDLWSSEYNVGDPLLEEVKDRIRQFFGV